MADPAETGFGSQLWTPQERKLEIAGNQYVAYRGGGQIQASIAEAYADVGTIAFIGCASQGSAQGPCFEETFQAVGANTRVIYGLRPNGGSRPQAREMGFTEENGKLMDTIDAVRQADVMVMAVGDEHLVRDGDAIFKEARAGTDVVFLHGFYLGYLATQNRRFRDDVGVAMWAPKGLGPGVRSGYLKGRGVNSSVGCEQGDSTTVDHMIGGALSLNPLWVFPTTIENEKNSDLTGERGILLGGLDGLAVSLYEWKLAQCNGDAERAYLETVETIIGPISETILTDGLPGVFDRLDDSGKAVFAEAYNIAYPKLKRFMEEIYRSVKNGDEIRRVIDENAQGLPTNRVENEPVYATAAKVRKAMQDGSLDARVTIDPVAAALYVAGMMAQADVLIENGHNLLEVAAESVYEAADSLNPHMRLHGLAKLVNDCSITARRGENWTRVVFAKIYGQDILPVFEGLRRDPDGNYDHFRNFLTSPVHQAVDFLCHQEAA